MTARPSSWSFTCCHCNLNLSFRFGKVTIFFSGTFWSNLTFSPEIIFISKSLSETKWYFSFKSIVLIKSSFCPFGLNTDPYNEFSNWHRLIGWKYDRASIIEGASTWKLDFGISLHVEFKTFFFISSFNVKLNNIQLRCGVDEQGVHSGEIPISDTEVRRAPVFLGINLLFLCFVMTFDKIIEG